MVELILTLCKKKYLGCNCILIVVKWVFLVEKALKFDLNPPIILVEFLFEKN